jgi:RNA polymerase subunit RPABC4/transcription elongation factor Spt4
MSDSGPSGREQLDAKVCPACAETVKDAAVICRYCGHDFRATSIGKQTVIEKAVGKLASPTPADTNIEYDQKSPWLVMGVVLGLLGAMRFGLENVYRMPSALTWGAFVGTFALGFSLSGKVTVRRFLEFCGIALAVSLVGYFIVDPWVSRTFYATDYDFGGYDLGRVARNVGGVWLGLLVADLVMRRVRNQWSALLMSSSGSNPAGIAVVAVGALCAVLTLEAFFHGSFQFQRYTSRDSASRAIVEAQLGDELELDLYAVDTVACQGPERVSVDSTVICEVTFDDGTSGAWTVRVYKDSQDNVRMQFAPL